MEGKLRLVFDMSKAYLVLENGSIYEGLAFGAETEAVGEVVFTTGMTGYLETLTDKSYFGQIVVQTFPLIGNYGVIEEDFEGERVIPNAYIVKEVCSAPSNFRSGGTLDEWLKREGVPGLYGIDTRALTKEIRERGVMNGKLVYSREKAETIAQSDHNEVKDYRITEAVESTSVKEKAKVPPTDGEIRYRVALLDFGYKKNIARSLAARGCEVTVCPCMTTAAELREMAPDGIMLSNGPGDPADNTGIIENLKEIIKLGIPIFGICLGHQLLALANGFQTKKLKFGHRGANQPVLDVTTGRTYITSQNHGYAVVSDSIDGNIAFERFYNVNDRSCEGIEYKNANVRTVQFHPEACGGPLDTSWLFDEFTGRMEEYKNAAE